MTKTETMKLAMEKSTQFFFYALMLIMLASCATSVVFDVEHPPAVDLRGVRTITIIPFENNSSRQLENLSMYATSALTRGIINSIPDEKISFIEPRKLRNVAERELWQYADVYVKGRITGVTPTIASTTDNQYRGTQTISIDIVTCTVTVDIEYSYIRARDGVILETFRKRQADSRDFSVQRMHRRPANSSNSGNQNHQGQGRPPGGFDPGQPPPDYSGINSVYGGFAPDRYRRRGTGNFIMQANSWEESLAVLAINKFSSTMSQELVSWTTTEKRNIRRRAGKEPVLDEAGKLVRANKYGQALEIYQEVYRQGGNAFAGYNNAILLAANRKFTEARQLLEDLHKNQRASGKNTPRVIRKELQRMTEIVNWFKILDEYKTSDTAVTAAAITAVLPQPSLPRNDNTGNTKDDSAQTRELWGTINSNSATVYALKEAIGSADDASVWTKIIAASEVSSADANALGGAWSLKIPASAPSLLWFAVMDSFSHLYLTHTALNTAGAVVLDTAQMIRLE